MKMIIIIPTCHELYQVTRGGLIWVLSPLLQPSLSLSNDNNNNMKMCGRWPPPLAEEWERDRDREIQ